MTKTVRDVSFRSCPSCGSVLTRGALTCSYCGGVIAVENVLSRLRAELKHQINRGSLYLRDRNRLIWVLAMCPLFILPPILAVLMSLRNFRASEVNGRGAAHNLDGSAILIVAICNIVLSLLLWRWLSEISLSSGVSIGVFLKSIGISSPRTSLQEI
jgi:hypothetical protein